MDSLVQPVRKVQLEQWDKLEQQDSLELLDKLVSKDQLVLRVQSELPEALERADHRVNLVLSDSQDPWV